MKIVGHKGAVGHAPENTIASFQKAIELGCDRTELDVRLSKDDQIIVIHDNTVDRTTNGKGKVSDMTLSELKKLDCELGQKIPTLQEVIDICKDKIDLQIELKGKNTALPVSKVITSNNIQDKVLVTSFHVDRLREIKASNSSIKVGLLFDKDPEELWNLVKQMPLEYICPKSNIVTEIMLNKAHEMGISVYAYGVNDMDAWNKMSQLGVDDIGTDFPNLGIM
jgi:glycerophosphoryl diester phosphodiesterase